MSFSVYVDCSSSQLDRQWLLTVMSQHVEVCTQVATLHSDLRWEQRNAALPVAECKTDLISNSAYTSFCTVKVEHLNERTRRDWYQSFHVTLGKKANKGIFQNPELFFKGGVKLSKQKD